MALAIAMGKCEHKAGRENSSREEAFKGRKGVCIRGRRCAGVCFGALGDLCEWDGECDRITRKGDRKKNVLSERQRGWTCDARYDKHRAITVRVFVIHEREKILTLQTPPLPSPAG